VCIIVFITPMQAKDINILLIRRCPRDKTRKQRVPFIARPQELLAALECMQKNHIAFTTPGILPADFRVNIENVGDYAPEAESCELQVQELDQQDDLVVDRHLFGLWMQCDNNMQLNVLLHSHLDGLLEKRDTAPPIDSDEWAEAAWTVLGKWFEETGEMVAGFPGPCQDFAFAKGLEQILGHALKLPVLETLRDELTAVHEMRAAQEYIDSSGTWAPDDFENLSAQSDTVRISNCD
jgi:hypothetical protein